MPVRLRVFMNHLPGLAFLILSAGCAAHGVWAPRPIELPYPFQPSDVVWIWSSHQVKVQKWHAVVLTPDSVSGIPYRMALKCDSCRRSMPRAQVDSMKLGPPTRAPKPLELAGALGAVLLLEMVICSALGAKNGC